MPECAPFFSDCTITPHSFVLDRLALRVSSARAMSQSDTQSRLKAMADAIAGSWDGRSDVLGEWRDRSDLYELLYREYESTKRLMDEKDQDLELAIAFREILICTLRSGFLESGDDSKRYRQFHINIRQLDSLQKVASILDFFLYMYQEKLDKYAKRLFFQSLIHVVNYLIRLWGPQLEVFWEYMETRDDLIIGNICDDLVVQDRMDMLEVCNLITDYYHTTPDKPAELATIRDPINFKVRSYISRALLFVDKTGLNSSYSGAGRLLPPINSSDRFVVDFYTTQEMMNDPQKWIRMTPGKRVDTVFENMYRLVGHLCEHPKKADFDAATIANLKFKIPYLPFSIWDIYGDEKFDAKAVYNLIDEPGFRLEFMTQVMVFLKRLLGGDQRSMGLDVRVTQSMEKYGTRTLDTCSKYLRATYPPYSKLLDHFLQSEYSWWSWLQSGKNKEGRTFLPCVKLDVPKDIGVVDDDQSRRNLETMPLKHTYMTQTLTKIMSAPTSIETFINGKQHIEINNEEKQEIESLGALAKAGDSDALDKRNTILWKALRRSQGENILLMTEKLGTQDLFVNLPLVNLYDLQDEDEKEENGDVQKQEDKHDELIITPTTVVEMEDNSSRDIVADVQDDHKSGPANAGHEDYPDTDKVQAHTDGQSSIPVEHPQSPEDARSKDDKLSPETTPQVDNESNVESNMSSLSPVETPDSQSLEVALAFDATQSTRKRGREDFDSDDEPLHKRHHGE